MKLDLWSLIQKMHSEIMHKLKLCIQDRHLKTGPTKLDPILTSQRQSVMLVENKAISYVNVQPLRILIK